MVRKPMLPTSMLCVVVLASFAGQVHAAFANLVRQYALAMPNGQSAVVCVYALDGKEFERQYPAGNFCPARVEI